MRVWFSRISLDHDMKQKIRGAGRLKATLSRQTPNNSYSQKLFYEDYKFKCHDCGVECVWTAEQQLLWFEKWGGPIQSTAVRCRACRQKLRRAKIEQKTHMIEMERKKKSKGKH